MSDPGLDADLTLDIRAALSEVSKLEEAASRSLSNVRMTVDARAVTAGIDAAVLNADTNVALVADAAALTGEVTAAVDAADTAVVITGDAAELTGSVTAAVDAGDTSVVVTGDASELTGDVTAAVDAADTTVTVTGSVDGGLRDGVRGLGDDLGDASAQAGLLRGSLAGLSAAAVVAGLYQMATAASDFAESSSKASTVFGDSFEEIDRFAADAATSVGLSATAALEATGTFGNLFQAMGATQDVAADLSPQVVTLASDLASFNNLGTDEVLEKLRSGLVGEVEPLRGLGVSFTAAQVEAKAFELGLAAVGEEVSEGAKLQARFALIMEQTTLAQGDFARTSGGLANQQRILSAEFQNAVTVAGQALLPTLLELVGVAREQLIPGFSKLATEVLPPLASVVSDLAPLFGVTLDLLVALAPVLGVIASVVDSIPEPLLVLVGSFIALNKAMPTNGLLTMGNALQGLANKAGGVVQGISSMNPVVLGVAAAFTVYTLHAQQAAAEERRMKQETEELTSALTDQDGVVRVTTDGIAKYIETQSRFGDHNQIDDLGRLKLTYEEVAQATLDGAKGQDRFIDAAIKAGEVTEVLVGAGDSLMDMNGKSLGTWAEVAASMGGVKKVGDRVFAGNVDLITSYEELTKVEERAAKKALEQAVAAGAITQAQREEFESTNKAKNGHVNYAAALNDAQAEIDRHAAAIEAATEKYGPQIAAAKALGTAYTTLAEENVSLADALVNFREEGVENDTQVAKFAQGLQAATVSEEAMAAAAALLGTDVDSLTTFIEGSNEAIDGFVQSVVDGLPKVSDAFADTSSVSGFVSNLQQSTKDVGQFMADLDTIFKAGGQDISATLGQLGLEGGAKYARELAASVSPNGKSALVTETEKAVDDHNVALGRAEEFLRESFGPAYIASTGLIASLASEALGSNLTFAERTRIAANLAQTTLDEEGRAIALIAATEGAEAAQAYADLFKISDKTLAEGLAASATLAGPVAESLGVSATTAGTGVITGYELGMLGPTGGGPAGTTTTAFVGATAAIQGQYGILYGAGAGAGTSGLTGFEDTWSGLTPAAVGQVDAATAAVTGKSGGVHGAGAAAAQGGVTGWEDTWSQIPAISTTAVTSAVQAVAGQAGAAGTAGKTVGTAAIDATSTALGVTTGVVSAMDKTINQVANSVRANANDTGRSIGVTFTAGVADGIGNRDGVAKVAAAAAAVVRKAEAAARAEAQSKSPSKLFAKLGRDLGAGVELGLAESIDSIAAEGARMARAAADAFSGTVLGGNLPTLDTSLTVNASAVAAAGGAPAGGIGQLILQLGDIMVTLGSGDPAEARAAAEQIVDTIVDRFLSEREVAFDLLVNARG